MKFRKFLVVAHTEFWDRINYYGLQSLLILYLTEHFQFSDANSYSLYGTYTALAFGFSILGGVLADKFMGFYRAVFLGAFLILSGNLLLMLPKLTFVYLGLTCIVLGIGFLKPNNVSLLGLIYKEDTFERTRAFSLFYFCLNIGTVFGPILYGLGLGAHYYWLCFLFSVAGMATSACSVIFDLSKMPPNCYQPIFKNLNYHKWRRDRDF